MGSPDISVPFLEFLHKKNENIIVFSQKDKVRKRGKKLVPTPVKQFALDKNIPVFTDSIKSKKSFEVISDFKPDLFLVVAYGQILPERILSLPKIAPVNVHFSLLPKYRGPIPVNASLLNGDKKTGTTLMFMDKGMDTGDILAMSELEISITDNATTLFKKLVDLSLDLLEENWSAFKNNDFNRKKQTGEATYTKLIEKDDLILDWNQKAVDIVNKIRAFSEIPGVKTSFRDKNIILIKASVSEEIGKIGEIVFVDKKHCVVSCQDASVSIEILKPAGKKNMTINSFIAGNRPQKGEFFK